MRIAIMQPYFFPYLGHFSLIKHTDRFVINDAVQYIKQGWIARNRILQQGQGWTYINVPLMAHSQDTLIKDIMLHNKTNWKHKIMGQLRHYPNRPPHLKAVEQLCADIFSADFDDIVSLNVSVLEGILAYLGIDREIEIFSKMHLEIEAPTDSDEWPLNICKALGNIDEYWNPPGGKSFYDRNKFEQAGIKLCFHEIELNAYNQNAESFEPGLSILDAMMFHSPQEINQMLDQYQIS